MDSLDSDIRPLDSSREIFKSTPNLKDIATISSGGGGGSNSNDRISPKPSAPVAQSGASNSVAAQNGVSRKIANQVAENRHTSTSPIGHGLVF